MKLTVEVDESLLHDAQSIYDTIGIDTDTAIRMFLKRTVLEQRLPLSTGAPIVDERDSGPSANVTPKRTKNAITQPMVEDIWRRFLRYLDEGDNINALAADAHTTTGMNQGSAFIYLTILDNLVNGKHNTRNMKMADLKYYMCQIENELNEQSYRNAIQSLRLSIPYWDKEEFGMFASKVQAFVNELPDEHKKESEKTGMVLAAKSTAEELKEGFMDYLVNQGYSVTTPKGRPSTVYDYAKRIECICERENITWRDLASQIDYYCSRYEIGGSEEEYGSKSHNAPRAALQCFNSFLHENRHG